MSQFASSITDYLSAHPYLAILILFLVAFGEAMLFIGLFVPSTPVMIGAGALVGLGKLGLLPVLVAGAAGAIAGDALSFWIGRRGKSRLLSVWPLSSHPELLATGERFFARHGSLSIFLARFVPVVKAILPTVAGMAGMSPARFAVVNVASAIMWSAAHVLPSMLVGRGLGVAATANPKVIELFAVVLVLSITAWIAARILSRRIVPRLAEMGNRIVLRWEASDRPVLRRIGRQLTSSTGASSLFFEAAFVLAAATALAILVALVVFDPGLSRADAALSGWMRALQSDLATRLFVGVTMLADWRVLFPVATVILIYLAVLREWRLAAVVAGAFAATLAFVPSVKFLMHRARPTTLYDGAEAFSFPSGHATHATVILGIAGLLLASGMRPSVRRVVYGTVAGLVAIVAMSRVYLGAHWPTDVIAGTLFGAVVLTLVATLTRTARAALPRKGLSVVVIGALAVAYGTHVAREFGTALAFYEPAPMVQTVARTSWTDGKVPIPANRILLDGDPGEPMLWQTDLPLPDLVARLQADGWSLVSSSWIAEVADAVLPTRGPLSSLAPWPLTHVGRQPMATLTRDTSGSTPTRQVLRLWDSGIRVGGAEPVPVVLASRTTETLDPLVAGLWMLDADAGSDPAQAPRILPGLKTVTLADGPPILTID